MGSGFAAGLSWISTASCCEFGSSSGNILIRWNCLLSMQEVPLRGRRDLKEVQRLEDHVGSDWGTVKCFRGPASAPSGGLEGRSWAKSEVLELDSEKKAEPV